MESDSLRGCGKLSTFARLCEGRFMTALFDAADVPATPSTTPGVARQRDRGARPAARHVRPPRPPRAAHQRDGMWKDEAGRVNIW